MDIVAWHFETKSDAHLRACYIAQSVMGLGSVNRLHCWWMRTSASNSAVCDSVRRLSYPMSCFTVVFGVGSELLLFFNSGTTPSWSSFFSFVIFVCDVCVCVSWCSEGAVGSSASLCPGPSVVESALKSSPDGCSSP